MQNSKPLTTRYIALVIGIGMILPLTQPRRAEALVSLALAGGVATAFVVIGAVALGGGGALAAGTGLTIIPCFFAACDSRVNDRLDFLLVTSLIALGGVILLDESSEHAQFAQVTSANRADFQAILTPDQLGAYEDEYEDVQIIAQEIALDLAQAGDLRPRELFQLSGQRWQDLGGRYLSPLAEQATAALVRASIQL